jgi:iron complex outermembrane receptor protein
MWIVSRKTVLGCGAAIAVLALATSANAQQQSFNVPAQDAVLAIPEFARQAGIQITAPASRLAGVRTAAVRGDLDTREALALLLDGTGLEIASDNGAVIALRVKPEAAQDDYVTGETTSVESIVVTGSRIVRDGYQAPSPTSVISSEDIALRAPANVADYVNQLPQMGTPTSPRTVANSSATTAGGANLLNARGLGASRTLVLLDGRRVVSAGLNGAVDVNLLPTNLLRRVDVVTGGASAAYGSDAVAGVVNFILDTSFTGVKGSASYGVTDVGDAKTWQGDIGLGTFFAEGRGHAMFSGQYYTQEGVDDINSRDWYQPGFANISNPAFRAGGSEPGFLVRNDVGHSRALPGGLISTGPLRGTAFGPGGSIQQFQFGDITAGNLQAGGTLDDPKGVWGPMLDNKNWATYGRVSYELTDTITAIFEASWAGSDGANFSASYNRMGDITIRSDNAFLPAQIRQAMATNNLSSFAMGRLNYDLVNPGGRAGEVNYFRRQERYLAALEGSFLETGTWRTYYQRGESDTWFTRGNNVIPTRYNLAIDAIANPAVGGVAGVAAGAPICRSTLTNPNNGCQPMNLFGVGSPTQASIDWVVGRTEGLMTRQDNNIYQDVWAIDAQYEPFSTWAGPVSIAGGYEYRKEGYTAKGDETSAQNLWFSSNYSGGQGEFTVSEYFGEIIVPLLKDVSFARSLDLNAAGRRTDYSTSGEVTTWKVGLTWDVNDDLRVRWTQSRDIRAPNLNDLYSAGAQFVDPRFDSSQPSRPIVPNRAISGGNPNLTPEIADTLTGGLVYSPSWLPGFSASVDYYKIEIEDAIVSIGAQSIIDQCYGVGVVQNLTACNSIVKAPGRTDLVDATVYTGGINASAISVEGVDYEFSYRTEVADLFENVPGSLSVRVLASNMLKDETELAGTVTNNLGTLGSLKWRGLFSTTYSNGPSRTTVSLRYIGDGNINNWPLGNAQSLPREFNTFDSVTYVELAQNYDITVAGRPVTVYGIVENLFDQDPRPIATGAFGTSTVYDLLGRSFRVGARFRF